MTETLPDIVEAAGHPAGSGPVKPGPDPRLNNPTRTHQGKQPRGAGHPLTSGQSGGGAGDAGSNQA